MTGQDLVLLLWTLWLVVALLALGGRPGVIVTLAAGALGLGLGAAGLLSWREFLMAGLTVAVLGAASRSYVQIKQPALPRRRELTVTARNGWLRFVPAGAQSWQQQVLSASVSLAGLVWLLILRPSVPWVYQADIPIMMGTVAVLVAVEYRCWQLYDAVNRRLAATMHQLGVEQKQRQESDAVNLERSERLEKRAQAAEAKLQQAQAELRGMHTGHPPAGDEMPSARGQRGPVAGRPPGGPGDPPVWFWWETDANSGAEGNQAADARPVRIELIRISRLNARPGTSAGEPGRLVGVTMERGTVMVWPERGESADQVTKKAQEHLRHVVESATAEHTAHTTGGPAWGTVSEHWVTKDTDGIDAAAGMAADLASDINNILLNKPAQLLNPSARLTSPASRAPGGAAEGAGLPADRLMDTLTRVIQIGGIVLCGVSGQPVMVSAFFKSLVHDQFIRALDAVIDKTFPWCEHSSVGQQETVPQREADEPIERKQAGTEREAG